MKRSCLLSAFILLALSILLLSGCSSHSPDEGADEPKVVTLGVWKNDAILPNFKFALSFMIAWSLCKRN